MEDRVESATCGVESEENTAISNPPPSPLPCPPPPPNHLPPPPSTSFSSFDSSTSPLSTPPPPPPPSTSFSSFDSSTSPLSTPPPPPPPPPPPSSAPPAPLPPSSLLSSSSLHTDDGYPRRKHSSGDLHSRLKTRKILGVGETDNGDIHRSKISQVLGHNEHLYVKLPRGFWSAHVAMGVGVTLEAGLLLLTPRLASRVGVMPYDDGDDDDDDDTIAARVAGAALAGLCVFVWSLLGTSDKHYARTMLLSMLTYHILSICVTAAAFLTTQEAVVTVEEEVAADPGVDGQGGGGGDDGENLMGSRLAMWVGARSVMCLLCLAYFYSIAGYAPIRGQKPTGFRQPAHGQKDQ